MRQRIISILVVVLSVVASLLALNALRSTLHAPLTTTSLARRLRPFGVNPFTLRIGGHLAKGYDLTDFAQPFSHFLNDAPS